MRTLPRAVLALLTISACTEAPTEAPFTRAPTPLFAGGAKAQFSRAHLVWADQVDVATAGSPADWQPAGIQGDDRNRFGVAGGLPSDEYQGAFCGVAAFIFNSRPTESGTLKVDPDSEYLTSMASTLVSAPMWARPGNGASSRRARTARPVRRPIRGGGRFPPG